MRILPEGLDCGTHTIEAMRVSERQQRSFLYQLFNVLLLSGTHFLTINGQTLSSNRTGEPLCPDEIVIFTCETRGSTILAWTSDEYIEPGGTRLELATFNDVGDIRTSPVNSNTVATLIDETNENGVDVLVSTLRIRAVSEFLDSSVTCIHVDGGTMNTTWVQVLADAAAPQIQDRSALRLGNDANETCIAQLSWNSPINVNLTDIKHYEVRFYGQLVANEMGNKNFVSAVYIYEECNCTEFSIRAVNRCDRPGRKSITTLDPPRPATLLQSRTLDCDARDLTTEQPTVFVVTQVVRDSTLVGVIIAVVVCSIITILAIVFAIILYCIVRRFMVRKVAKIESVASSEKQSSVSL